MPGGWPRPRSAGWRAVRRYRTARRAPDARGERAASRAGGLPMAALAGSGVVTGLLALAFVLGGAS